MDKRKKSLLRSVVLMLSVWLPLTAGAQTDQTLDTLIRRAWAAHPDLASMKRMVQVEQARRDMSAAWMNPTFGAGLMDVPQTLNVHSDAATMFQFKVMQRIPFPGKLDASRQAGEANVKAAKGEYDAARQNMAEMIAMNYYTIVALNEVDSLLRVGESLSRDQIVVAEAMSQAGMGGLSDVERARLEVWDWQQKIITNSGERARRSAELAYAAGGELDTAEVYRTRLPLSLPPIPSLDSLAASGALESAPEIAALREQLSASEFALTRARREWYPDADVMFAYGIKPWLRTNGSDPMTGSPAPSKIYPDNMLSLEVSFMVPLFSTGNQKAAIAESRAMARRSAYELQKARLDLRKRLEQILAGWNEQGKHAQLISAEIIPAADALYRSSLADYRAGRTPFMALTEARMRLIMAQVDLAMSRAMIRGYQAEWSGALGLFVNELSEDGNEER